MPNVNYRGKPSQDPNAPPESGVTSIPLGSPWPPLSREQVVKLHEALVAFRGEMEASKGIRSHEDQQDMIWGAAVELDGLLVEMNIGSPPSTKTWTHEEVAKVAEEVQSFSDAQSAMDCIFATMPVKNVSGRELKAGEMVTTAQMQVVPETRPPYLWTPDGKFRAMSPGEVASIVERADGKPTFRVTQGDAMPAGTDRDYLLVASAPDVPRRQEGRWEEPPKRNCWTCDHDKVFGGGTAHICTALPPRRSKGTGDSPTVKAISAWTDSQTLDASLMPPKDSDGCPGWEPKP